MPELAERLNRDLETARSVPSVLPTPIELKRLEREILALEFRFNVLNSVAHGDMLLAHFKGEYIRFADKMVPLDDHKHAVSVAEYRKKNIDPKIRRPNKRVYEAMRARQIFNMDLNTARFFASGKATRTIEIGKGERKVIPVSLDDLIKEEDLRLSDLRAKWWQKNSRSIRMIWSMDSPAKPSLDRDKVLA